MKKTTLTLGLSLSLGALVSVGCTAGNEHTPKDKQIEVSITATSNTTRTYVEPKPDGGFKPLWSTDDKLGVFGTRGDNSSFEIGLNIPFTIDPGSIGGEDYVASFTGTLTDVAAGEAIDAKYYAYYPYNTNATTPQAAAMTIPLPATQKPTQTSFDGAADLLVGYPVETTAPVGKIDNSGGGLNFGFARIVAVGSFGVKGIPTSVEAETVEQVTISFGSPVAGEVIADLTSKTPTYYLNTESASTSVTLDYSDRNVSLNSDFKMWWTMISGEVTLNSITIETTNHTLSKEYTDAVLNFQCSKVTTATIDLATATLTPKVVPFTPFTEDFEHGDFTISNQYSKRVELNGPSGRQWGILSGTIWTNPTISGKRSLQFRLFKDYPKYIPSAYTDFDLVGLRRVSFWATLGGGNYGGEKLRLDYSTDGGKQWVEGQSFTLTDTAKEYSYTLPETVLATDAVRIRFTTTDTAPTGSSAPNFNRYLIDDISFLNE